MVTFVIASGVVWFFLVEGPRAALKKQRQARSDAQTALDKSRKQMNDAARSKAALEASQRRLDDIESKMPAGDPYRWLVKAFGEFPAASHVSIANIEAPHVSESTIYPKVPYKAATFAVSGTGFYHEFGTFLAELENEFPHMRVRRLELTPAYPGESDTAGGRETQFPGRTHGPLQTRRVRCAHAAFPGADFREEELGTPSSEAPRSRHGFNSVTNVGLNSNQQNSLRCYIAGV